jgi:hypothetical protein
MNVNSKLGASRAQDQDGVFLASSFGQRPERALGEVLMSLTVHEDCAGSGCVLDL